MADRKRWIPYSHCTNSKKENLLGSLLPSHASTELGARGQHQAAQTMGGFSFTSL